MHGYNGKFAVFLSAKRAREKVADEIEGGRRRVDIGYDRIVSIGGTVNDLPPADICFRALSSPFCWRVVWIFARTDIGTNISEHRARRWIWYDKPMCGTAVHTSIGICCFVPLPLLWPCLLCLVQIARKKNSSPTLESLFFFSWGNRLSFEGEFCKN